MRGILKCVDGYDILLKKERFDDKKKKVFFLQFGYNSNEFTELHKNLFVVAENEPETKSKAKETIYIGMFLVKIIYT